MQSEINRQSLKNLELIQNHLQHGDYAAIAAKVGKSRQTVSNTLSGLVQKPDQKIIQAALRLIKARKKSASKLEESINKSLNF